MGLRGVGIDVLDIRRITGLINKRGEAFTDRWFTRSELAQSNLEAVPAAWLASRLAAKEAVWKSLGLDGNRSVPWHSIEVLTSSGREVVVLNEGIFGTASCARVVEVSLTVTLVDNVALAMAISWTPD